jgi:hypothetical protein
LAYEAPAVRIVALASHGLRRKVPVLSYCTSAAATWTAASALWASQTRERLPAPSGDHARHRSVSHPCA